MNCPACDTPLMTLEYESTEVDYCAACGGVWLDADEVRLLFGEAQAAATFFASVASDGVEPNRALRCPISGKRLNKGHVGGTAGHARITVDFSDHGLWLDRGELSQLLQQGLSIPAAERLTAWLLDVFPPHPQPVS